MSLLSRLQSPNAVQSALNEFSNLGQASFLKRYGFGKSKSYRVRNPLNREECDIKAIVAVAYGVQFPADGPLTAADIPESEKALAAKLEQLGFETVRIGESWSRQKLTLQLPTTLKCSDSKPSSDHSTKPSTTKR